MIRGRSSYSKGGARRNRSLLYTERRRYPRIKSDIGIVFEQNGELVFCQIKDVSAGGALIETDYHFGVGQRLSFYVAENRLGVPLEAEVVRIRRGAGRRAIGVRFTDGDGRFPATREDQKMYLLNYPVHRMW